MKLSTCCGSAPVSYPGPHGTPDSDSEDHGICPECGEHCDYEEETDGEIEGQTNGKGME